MSFVPFVSSLDAPLLLLSSQDNFTLEDATEGVHAFGGIGSGKTTGTGKMLSGAYLRAGFGGLVTAVKPEEVELWKRYANEHGRGNSLILFDENEGFNFLTYELARQGMEGIGTVTECLMRILEAAKKISPTSAKGGDNEFFESSTRMTLRYTIAPLYAAYGQVSVGDIIRFVSAAPKSEKEAKDAAWQQGSFLYRTIKAALDSPRVRISEQGMKNTIDFWSQRYVSIPEKTRGNIEITVGTVLDRFLHGRLARIFCGRTTLVPELTFHGAVVVLAMPTLTWNEDGIIAQQLFKYMWQRAVLGRNSLAQEHRQRPVFLWSDEAQETVSSYDFEFQSICRGSKCCTVYLTQSLPTYYAKMGGGGDNGRDAAHALVGKFNTHVYHSNACPETNEFASRMIGKVLTRRGNFSQGSSQSFNEGMSAGNSQSSGDSSSYSMGQGIGNSTGSNSSNGNNWGDSRGRGTSENFSRGYSESIEYVIEPGDFARILKTGGKANGGIVTGLWFQSGRMFHASDGNMMIRRFKQ